ncbi:M48 family metallopeptidase [Patescibacteria group bacterium]|nr:M48 family metallopeptidase [Patescibacteria group bacterium]MBU1890529.1 M48 family metallopeptidase [Patescibacteria group bacterium]
MYKQIAANKRKTAVLIFFFITLIGAIGWAIGAYFEMGYSTVVWALVIAVILSLFSFYSGDKVALATAGAHRVSKEQNPYVYRLVENLCITAGLAMPKIHIINDPAPNAFATGRDPKHASIALTSGLIEQLENEELEGVIAHELSHIKNYDIRLMTIVIICVGLITLLADIFLRGSLFGGGRRKEGGNILAIIGLVLIILSPIFARLIQSAVSRKREFLADASGALLTRYPEGLARALEKIAQYNKPIRRPNNATAHLYFFSPFGLKKKGFSRAFSTHPPTAERIKALRAMA